jgi:hypothetical protein
MVTVLDVVCKVGVDRDEDEDRVDLVVDRLDTELVAVDVLLVVREEVEDGVAVELVKSIELYTLLPVVVCGRVQLAPAGKPVHEHSKSAKNKMRAMDAR